MSAESVALAPRCTECGAYWLPADEERRQAHLGCDERLAEPAELFFYCPECAEREFEADEIRPGAGEMSVTR